MPEPSAKTTPPTDDDNDDVVGSSLPETAFVRDRPSQRVSSLSLTSIGELQELETEFDKVELGGTRRREKFSLDEVDDAVDEDLLEARIRSSMGSDISIDLDVIGGVRDSLAGKHAKNATFKKDPAERAEAAVSAARGEASDLAASE
mmetsp:Transcript_17631/g.48036  ORF Transcript_17631/g.48036 Transcript_17631/m.48036 type:complete len:147 (-) Transcript_17631:302-742(-)